MKKFTSGPIVGYKLSKRMEIEFDRNNQTIGIYKKDRYLTSKEIEFHRGCIFPNIRWYKHVNGYYYKYTRECGTGCESLAIYDVGFVGAQVYYVTEDNGKTWWKRTTGLYHTDTAPTDYVIFRNGKFYKWK